MQYEAVAAADAMDRLAETVAAQRGEIDRLRSDLDGFDRCASDLAAARRDNDQLRGLLAQRVEARVARVVRRVGQAAARRTLGR